MIVKTPKFIEFRVSNYRSIRDEVIFSTLAKEEINDSLGNTFEIELSGGQKIRLLKTAAIYGANASGKSNFLKAFSTFLKLLSDTSSKNLEDKIDFDPFLLNKSIEGKPTNYFFEFIGSNFTLYQYKFSHTSTEIVEESLSQFSNGKFISVFKRDGEIVELGEKLSGKQISPKIIPPRLYLSHLTNNLFEEIVSEVYRNIQRILSWSLVSIESRNALLKSALERMAENSGNNKVNELVNRLITNADFQTLAMNVEATGGELTPYTSHKFFDEANEVGIKVLPFYSTASEGTKFFVGLIGVLAVMIEDGVPCLFDEINTSLHPDLCRLIIRLLNDPSVNKHNAQLIFSTHDISLLEKTFLRKDQLWFSEKNNYGSSELYSAQDFDDIPENVSLGELYDTGFFRAKPRINETKIKYPTKN